MNAFPDIPADESRRVARCLRVVEAVRRSVQDQINLIVWRVARCLRVVEAIRRSTQDQVMKNTESAEGVLPSCTEGTEGTEGEKGAKYTKGAKDTTGTKVSCDYPPEGHRDPLELIPDPEQAKFIALGAQLLIIRDLCRQDLRFKIFYDLTGSGGNAGLAAVFLQHWSKVVSLESSRAKLDAAVISRRMVQRVNSPDMLTRLAAWKIESGTFKQKDWVDGDVVFLDATILASLDEGVFCRYLECRLRALQAGSFVVLFTRCFDRLITKDSLQLISRQTIYHTGDRGNGGKFTSWLFKSTMHSNDYRVGVFDVFKRTASGKTTERLK